MQSTVFISYKVTGACPMEFNMTIFKLKNSVPTACVEVTAHESRSHYLRERLWTNPLIPTPLRTTITITITNPTTTTPVNPLNSTQTNRTGTP